MKNFLKFLFIVAAVATFVPILQTQEPVLIAATAAAGGLIVYNLVSSYVPTGILGMNTIAARMVFDNAKRAINSAFPIPESNPQRPPASELCKLTQSYLRLEQLIALNKSEYNFPVLVNQTTQGIFLTEQRLNQQDSFVISEVGIFLGLPATSSATDTAFVPDTYPNPFTYGAAQALAMQAIYSGLMKVTVNNDVLMTAWDLARHYYTPETQQTAALGAGSPLDQKRLAVDAFYPMEPNVVLIGSKNNQIQVTLPQPPTAIAANSRLIIILRGVLAQNSTVVS